MEIFSRLFNFLGRKENIDLDSSSKETIRAKELIRLYGPTHFTYYAHIDCADSLLQQIKSKGDTIDTLSTREYKPKDLIGKYKDITHCDQCGIEFNLNDKGYLSYFALKPNELNLLEQVRLEDAKK